MAKNTVVGAGLVINAVMVDCPDAKLHLTLRGLSGNTDLDCVPVHSSRTSDTSTNRADAKRLEAKAKTRQPKQPKLHHDQYS